MRCIIYYNSLVLFCILKVQAMKGLFLYNTTNGITTLKKHLNANHSTIAKLFEEAIDSPLKGKVEKKPSEKISNPSSNVIINFFVVKNLLHKDYM